MRLTSRSHPCDPAVAHQTLRIMGGLVRYREDATHPLHQGTQNSTALTNQTQRGKMGGLVRYRGDATHRPKIKMVSPWPLSKSFRM